MKTSIALRLRELGAESAEEFRARAYQATNEAIIEFVIAHGRRPSNKGSETEIRLGTACSHRTSRGRNFDAELAARLTELGAGSISERTNADTDKLVAFMKSHRRSPSRHIPNERYLAKVLDRRSYEGDRETKRRLYEAGYRTRDQMAQETSDNIVNFFLTNGRWPSGRRPISEDERKLSTSMANRIRSGRQYDAAFVARVEALGWKRR